MAKAKVEVEVQLKLGELKAINLGPETRLLVSLPEGTDAQVADRCAHDVAAWAGIDPRRVLLVIEPLKVEVIEP